MCQDLHDLASALEAEHPCDDSWPSLQALQSLAFACSRVTHCLNKHQEFFALYTYAMDNDSGAL